MSALDLAYDWRCAGCGKASPDKRRNCACPTGVLYVRLSRLTAQKIDPGSEEDLKAQLQASQARVTELEGVLRQIDTDPIDEPATWGGAAEWMRRLARSALSTSSGEGGLGVSQSQPVLPSNGQPEAVPSAEWCLAQAQRLSGGKDETSVKALAWNLSVAFKRWADCCRSEQRAGDFLSSEAQPLSQDGQGPVRAMSAPDDPIPPNSQDRG